MLNISIFMCFSGYTGFNCEQNIDDCVGNRCRNNSTCVDGVEEYKCKCSPHWTGKNFVKFTIN